MKMKENNKGSMIILTVIGIATLLVAVVGATFAYFTVQIQGNVDESTVQVQSSKMLITYAHGNKIDYTGAIPGRPEADSGIKNKLTFSLKSDNGLNLATKYYVYLVVDNNEFLPTPGETNVDNANELVYLSKQTERIQPDPDTIAVIDAGEDGIPKLDAKQTITTIHNNVESDPFDVGSFKSATLVKSDDLSTEENEEEITPIQNQEVLIGEGVLGSNGCEDHWEVEVWLKELQAEQNYNQGRNMTAHIEIRTDVYSHETVTTP